MTVKKKFKSDFKEKRKKNYIKDLRSAFRSFRGYVC
jgi:hypothetical protein